MNRREFFKFPAVVALLAAVPSLAKTVEHIPEAIPVKPSCIGWVREIMAYDIYNDCMIFRHDIGDGVNQYSVDRILTSEDKNWHKETYLTHQREVAIEILEKIRIKEKMGQLILLRLPNGIEHARYV